jgi:hypothetical protein
MSATALMERYAQRKQKRDQNILDTADVLRDVEKLSPWSVCNPGVIRWRRFFAFVFYLRSLPEPVGEFSF